MVVNPVAASGLQPDTVDRPLAVARCWQVENVGLSYTCHNRDVYFCVEASKRESSHSVRYLWSAYRGSGRWRMTFHYLKYCFDSQRCMKQEQLWAAGTTIHSRTGQIIIHLAFWRSIDRTLHRGPNYHTNTIIIGSAEHVSRSFPLSLCHSSGLTITQVRFGFQSFISRCTMIIFASLVIVP